MRVWWLVAGIGVLFLVAASISARRLRSAHGQLPLWPTMVLLVTVLYGVALTAVSLLPAPADSAEACVNGGRASRLTSLITFDEAWKTARGMGLSFVTSPSFVQIVSNIILFVPLGLLLGWRTRWPLVSAAAVGVATSLLVELTQATGVWGLYDCAYRTGDVQDLVTNTAGVVIGWLLGRRVLNRVSRP